MKPKHSNLETLTPSVSAARLRNVQKLLDDDGKGSKLDAILCILGVDGRYDEGCKELANYLLFGFYDTRHPEMEKLDFDEEAYEDLMIVVKRDSVRVYCHPALYGRVIDYVSHWRNLRLHCLRVNQADVDQEMVEDFKIKSFVSMVQGCDHIGLPYTISSLAHLQPFDKMVIEKWPIVQAYALDEITGGGFFTMKHQVTDIGTKVEQLYSLVDPVGLETIITKHLTLFERQWTNFLEHLDVAIADKDFDNLTEDKVGEALFTYYKHGRVLEDDQWKRKPSRQPFVFFGDHASKSNVEDLQKGIISDVTFHKKADLNTESLMVCQSVSPRGPLCCGRTYSLTPLHIQTPGSGLDSAVDCRQGPSKDAHVFQVLYSALIEGVEEAMSVYSKTLSVKQAETAALSKFSEQSSVLADDIVQNHIKKPGNVMLTIKGYDKDGSCQPLTEQVSCHLVKTVMMAAYELPSLTSPGKTIGSLLFAESFLDSSILVKKTDGSEWMHGEILVLTAHIPRLIAWSPETDDGCGEQIDGDRWGKVLSPAEIVHTTACNSVVNIPLEGKLAIWERGMLYSHHQLGSLALGKEQVTSLQLYDGDSPSKVAVLAVGTTPATQVYVPAPLTSSDNRILLAFFPKTKAYKNLFSVVLPSWKKESNFPNLERLEDLPEQFLERYDQLERLCASAGKGSQTVLGKAAVLHHNLKGFLSHLGVTSVCGNGVSERGLPLVLGQPVDLGQFDNPQEILITVVSGLPGSHKENLCQVLTNFAKEQNRWISFKQPLDSASLFNPKALQQSLSSTLHMLRKKHAAASNRQFSVLILTPGYTDVIDVVKAVTNHPDPSVKSSYRIGAITCCVDPQAVYMENRLTFPVFLNHCAEGWVNNIVFTSCTSPQNPVLSEVQELIRSVNDNVAYILAENAQVTRSTDIELILSRTGFSEDSMVRARHLLTPGWETGENYLSSGEPVIEEVILRFSQPLDRTKLVNKLKGLKVSNRGWPFTGNIYHFRGRTTFTSNVAKSFEMRFSVPSEKLDIHPVEATTSADGGNKNNANFVVFSGCELKEGDLKNWLRTTARQVSAKKAAISREDLTDQILADIHSKNHLEELPEGWFYNGHTYISLTGERSDQHPDMDKFIEKYLTKKNQEIKLFNARVDENNFPDLFA